MAKKKMKFKKNMAERNCRNGKYKRRNPEKIKADFHKCFLNISFLIKDISLI